MAYCFNCGVVIREGASFCVKCGKKVYLEDVPAATIQASNLSTAAVPLPASPPVSAPRPPA